MTAQERLEALRAIEWAGVTDDGAGIPRACCPDCHATKIKGSHWDFCAFVAMMTDIEAAAELETRGESPAQLIQWIEENRYDVILLEGVWEVWTSDTCFRKSRADTWREAVIAAKRAQEGTGT